VHVDSGGHLISTNIPPSKLKGSIAYPLRAQGSHTYLHAYILKMDYIYVYTIKSLPVLKSRCKNLPSHVIYLCLGSWFHSPPPFWWVRATGAWDIPNMQGWTQLQPIPGPLNLGMPPTRGCMIHKSNQNLIASLGIVRVQIQITYQSGVWGEWQ
jgi:hypothetical protein